ncbi:MAG: LytR/AlgR family response regulator transcription factor [Clostridium sp.]|uniref:LytR/AlgR family response regulator transcription factor n=1 Tax=Clostridium sp. TaxID=1506 RepID=UPI003EE5E238
MKIYICEDDEKFRKDLKAIIEKIIVREDLDMKIKKSTGKGNELLNSIEGTGIYFLDVDLKEEINGIELGSKIRKLDPNGFIIFITTYGEMGYLTFKYKVEAMDYIVKGDYENLEQRITECIKEANKRYILKENIEGIFMVKTREQILRIPYKEIMFFETAQKIHKIRIHSLNRQIEFYGKMKELEKELGDKFLRIHASYLVNKEKIKEIDSK